MTFTHFQHRNNPDGSYDSICRKCFAIIGTGLTKDQLPEVEGKHSCDPEVYWAPGTT